jgi:hypothetical protein
MIITLYRQNGQIKKQLFSISSIEEYDDMAVKSLIEGIINNKSEIAHLLQEWKSEFVGLIENIRSSNKKKNLDTTASFRDVPIEVKTEKVSRRISLTETPTPDKISEYFEQSVENLTKELKSTDLNDVQFVENDESIQSSLSEIGVEDVIQEEMLQVSPEEDIESDVTEVEEEVEEEEPSEEDIESDVTEVEEEVEEEEPSEEDIESDVTEVEEEVEELTPIQKAQKIVDTVNNEKIKFSSKEGKMLLTNLESLGFQKDRRLRQDKKTKEWYLVSLSI